jgi:hypothetical protein
VSPESQTASNKVHAVLYVHIDGCTWHDAHWLGQGCEAGQAQLANAVDGASSSVATIAPEIRASHTAARFVHDGRCPGPTQAGP